MKNDQEERTRGPRDADSSSDNEEPKSKKHERHERHERHEKKMLIVMNLILIDDMNPLHDMNMNHARNVHMNDALNHIVKKEKK